MTQLVVIALCLILGVILRRSNSFPESTGKVLGALVVAVAFPALVLVEVPRLIRSGSLSFEFAVSASVAWLVFIGVWALLSATLKYSKLSQATLGCLVLTAGLGNTAFIGLPAIEAFEGREALPLAIVGDQAGTFLVLSTLGIFVAMVCSGRSPDRSEIFRRITRFPPFIAVAIACIWGVMSYVPIEGILVDAFRRLSLLLVPLALMSVGWQLNLSTDLLAKRWRALSFGLGYKLLLAPIMILLFAVLLSIEGQSLRVLVLEAAMAPMITGAIVATEFDLDSELAQAMVGLGIPLSLLTVPAWWFILRALGF